MSSNQSMSVELSHTAYACTCQYPVYSAYVWGGMESEEYLDIHIIQQTSLRM